MPAEIIFVDKSRCRERALVGAVLHETPARRQQGPRRGGPGMRRISPGSIGNSHAVLEVAAARVCFRHARSSV